MAVRDMGRNRLLPGIGAGMLFLAACGGETVQTIETDNGAQVLRVESIEDDFEAPTTTVREYQETTRGPGATRTAPTDAPQTLAAVDDDEEGEGGDGTGTSTSEATGTGDSSTTEAPTTTQAPTTTAAPYAGEATLSLPYVGANGLTLQSARIVCSNPAVIEITVTSPNGLATSSQYVALTGSQGNQYAVSGGVADGAPSVPGQLSPALANGGFEYSEICVSSQWTVFVRVSDDAGNTFKGVVQASVN